MSAVTPLGADGIQTHSASGYDIFGAILVSGTCLVFWKWLIEGLGTGEIWMRVGVLYCLLLFASLCRQGAW